MKKEERVRHYRKVVNLSARARLLFRQLMFLGEVADGLVGPISSSRGSTGNGVPSIYL